MHVLVVVAGGLGDPGGVTRSMETLIASWSALKTPITYTIIDPRGCGHIMWSPLFFFKAFLSILFQKLKRKNIVAHINMCEYGSTVRKIPITLYCKLLLIPVVLHIHGAETASMYYKMPKFLKKLFGFCVGKSDRVVVLGVSWRSFICDVVGVKQEKVEIIPNAIMIPAELPKRSGNSECKILFLGRLGKRKGVDSLIKALDTPHVRNLEWAATFAGDGEIQKYREAVRRIGLERRISILGWVGASGVADLLKSADVLVLPSFNEGLPMAILEGMAHGLAVIATPVGAIGEVIVHNKTGLIVEPGNSSALAEALSSVIIDVPLRQRLAHDARLLAQSQFDARDFGVRFFNVYKALCA